MKEMVATVVTATEGLAAEKKLALKPSLRRLSQPGWVTSAV
jgi:hypothetical protein